MRSSLAGVAALAVLAPIAAQANLLVNGAFDQGVTDAYSTPVGWTGNAAWSIPSNAIYTGITGNGITFGGNYPTDQMALSQSFIDQIGVLYQVSVMIALFHPGSATVALDGITALSLTTDYSAPFQAWMTTAKFSDETSVAPAGFTTYLFDFVGTGYNSITLAGFSGYISPTFGNVSITQARPAPAPLLAAGFPALMMLGLGGLIGRLKNRFRRT